MIAVRGVLETLRELMGFFWKRRLWWLIPVVIVLLVFSVLIIIGSTAGIGPFIYTLF